MYVYGYGYTRSIKARPTKHIYAFQCQTVTYGEASAVDDAGGILISV